MWNELVWKLFLPRLNKGRAVFSFGDAGQSRAARSSFSVGARDCPSEGTGLAGQESRNSRGAAPRPHRVLKLEPAKELLAGRGWCIFIHRKASSARSQPRLTPICFPAPTHSPQTPNLLTVASAGASGQHYRGTEGCLDGNTEGSEPGPWSGRHRVA